MSKKQGRLYKRRSTSSLAKGNYYAKHTRELTLGDVSKVDIAAELAVRDNAVSQLRKRVMQMTHLVENVRKTCVLSEDLYSEVNSLIAMSRRTLAAVEGELYE